MHTIMQQHTNRRAPRAMAVLLVAVLATPGSVASAADLAGCPLLPDDNVWNTAIDTLPVAPRSAGSITSPPDRTVRLIFIHHSTGEAWLADDYGQLGKVLKQNRYFVSDTNYGWGPITPEQSVIGDNTDIGHWWLWFRSPTAATYLNALYAEEEQHSSYTRRTDNPGGPNDIILFKSCFPNSALQGSPSDPVPGIKVNPLRGQGCGSSDHTVANAKSIYKDLLNYFKNKRDTLFVAVTAPPLTDPSFADNARAFNQWLVKSWLKNYPYNNVMVFDYYNVLTTNGGSPKINDLNLATGNHHRLWNGRIQHKSNGDNDSQPNILEYPTGDDHPSKAGDLKATGEFIKLLNSAYHRWRPSLGEALDNQALVWSSGGAVPWFGETANGYALANAARSGRIEHGQNSWLSTTLTGPGTLRFVWRVSSEEGHDTLRFFVDGVAKGKISGTNEWVQRAVTLESGVHTVQWQYTKDAAGTSGSDAAWVDYVRWSGTAATTTPAADTD